ncbi:hypothetical protein [Paenibacillus luteus]|uniref:hypothetical protein n=1 Tax=Paenibacillus luteus TaxID=2545753 RepID=UPI0030C860C7
MGCVEFEGTLAEDGVEVQELRFFDFDDLPSELSPPDKPVIARFLDHVKASGNDPLRGE